MSGPKSPFDDSQAFQRALNAEQIESLKEENRAKRAETRETIQAERRATRNQKLLNIFTLGLYPLSKAIGRWISKKLAERRDRLASDNVSRSTVSTHGTGSTEQQPDIFGTPPAILPQQEAAASRKAQEGKGSWKDWLPSLPWNRAKKKPN